MILKRRIALDGKQLDGIDSRIIVRGFEPGAAEEAIQTTDRMGGSGQRITSRHWGKMEAEARFAINVPKTEMTERYRIFRAVMDWAKNGGWLTANWMEGKRLYVDKVICPNIQDPWAWTDEYTMLMQAYNVPFWQDEDPASVAGDFASGSLLLGVGGEVESVLDLTFRNTSGSTINTFSITAGDSAITLSGIALASGETLIISHGTDGIMRITAGGRNVYSKRSDGGTDDLYVNPGTVTVQITAEGAGRVIASCYGRYL